MIWLDWNEQLGKVISPTDYGQQTHVIQLDWNEQLGKVISPTDYEQLSHVIQLELGKVTLPTVYWYQLKIMIGTQSGGVSAN